MTTTRFNLLACLVFGMLLGVTLKTPAAASDVACPRVAFARTLDGRMDDWSPLPQLVVGEGATWHATALEDAHYVGAKDCSAEVHLAWDSQALYLAVLRHDDVDVRVRSASEIDRGDSLVLTFEGEGATEASQFVIALLRSRSFVWRVQPQDRAGEAHAVGRAIAAREDENGTVTTYEVALPWSELKGIRAIPGARFNLTVSLCDDDGNGLKGCLETSTGVALTTAGGGPIEGDTIGEGLSPYFSEPDSIRYDERSFSIKNKRVVLFGGEIEYWSLPESVWADRIARAKSAGFNTIAVSVPWSHYQPTQTAYDLSELPRFLDLCAAHGLWVQLALGPYTDDLLPAGGIPGWVLAAPSRREQEQALRDWLTVLLPIITTRQLSQGGTVISVLVRPGPDRVGRFSAAALEQLLTAVREAGITVPVLTANAPAARANTQAMVNILDTMALYEPRELADLTTNIDSFAGAESGPVVISGLVLPPSGSFSTGHLKQAFAQGAAGLIFTEFATGVDSNWPALPAGNETALIDVTGADAVAIDEIRLLGGFISRFGSELALSPLPGTIVKTDNPKVQALARYGPEAGFLFLSPEEATTTAQQVRLTYLDPLSGAVMTIPEAGAISLPAGEGKMLLLDTVFGRGQLRYCTSEPLALHAVGDRTVLVVSGDPDTPGEIALTLSGPPLVAGDYARQSWHAETKTLVLDYFHGAQDKHILVDDLELVVLSRARASKSLTAASASASVTIAADAQLAGVTVSPDKLTIMTDCKEGPAEFSAVLARPPSAVLLDGKAVPFTFTSPQRVLSVQVVTPPFSESQRPSSTWEKLSRSVLGPPPELDVTFERTRFYPEKAAAEGEQAGYAGVDYNDRRWYRIPLGPWRKQSTDLTDFGGVGWYRLDCKLPRTHSWEIPYYANLSIKGSGVAYFNGTALATLPDSGEYRLPIPPWLVRQNDKNILALALLGTTPEAGLYQAQLSADITAMTMQRQLEVRF